MKPGEGKAIIEALKKRGYIWDAVNSTYLPPNSERALFLLKNGINTRKEKNKRPVRLKTGWIDDTLNIQNKAKQIDTFIALVKQCTGLEVWPEFYFLTDRQYRFDYAIPIDQDNTPLRIAIECEGGIWAKGNSGHSSGTGIARDMDKSSKASVQGWTLIRRTPTQLSTHDTIDLIKQAYQTITGKAL